jgi:3-phenylpropionate/trans-cinnamate dioxygenase ferredoxin subunit
MDEKTDLEWHKLTLEPQTACAAPEIGVAELYGQKICISKFRDRWYGFSYQCPHAGGYLADGDIDHKGQVVCPVHGYRFDIRNGFNTTGEGYYLRHWPIEERQDGLYIKMSPQALKTEPE